MTTATLDRPTACIAPKPGLTGYKIHRCRCDRCTRESTAYNNRRDRLIAYGRWQPMVDAEPVRQHIRALMAAEIGWQRVARAAGVSTGGVSRILYGASGRGPCKKVKKTTADAILAVQPNPALRSIDSTIDATGTRRRTQALVALGWTLTEQATRLGRTIHNHKYVLTTDRVTIRTARLVAGLYDDLSTVTPPASIGVTRAKRWAQRNQWAPPMAWDDDTIDDPNARPDLGDTDEQLVDLVAVERALGGERVRLTRAERDEAFRVGLARGLTPYAIGRLLNLSADTYRALAARVTQAA